MHKTLLTLSVTAALLLTACGSNLKPMSSQEKDRFKSVLSSVGKSATALSALSKNSATSAGSSSSTPSSNDFLKGLAATTNPKDQKDAQEMSDRLAQAVRRGECTYMNTVPTDVGSGKIPSLKNARFTLNGSKCPVDIDLTLTVTGDEKNASADFHLKYESKDTSYSKLADIDKLDLNGNFQLRMVVPTESSARFELDFNMNLSGSAHSQSEGDFKPYLRAKMEMRGDTNNAAGMNGSGEFAFGIEMKDFTGEIKAVADFSNATSAAKPKFYVNNEEMTQEELQEWLSGTPFPVSSGN